MNKSRILYFDILRLISAFFVIYMHTASEFIKRPISLDWHLTNFFLSIAYVAVPIFFMLSGALHLKRDEVDSPAFLLKQAFFKLILPLLVWSVFYIFIAHSKETMTLESFFDYFFQSMFTPVFEPMWFMYTMISIYLLLPFLKLMINNMGEGHWKYLLGLIIINTILKTLDILTLDQHIIILWLWNIDLLAGNLSYFLLGYYFMQCPLDISLRKLMYALAINTLIIVLGSYWQMETTGIFMEGFKAHTGIFILVETILIFSILQKLPLQFSIVWEQVILPISQLGYGIYFAHIGFLVLLNPLIGSFSQLVLTSLLIFILSLASSFVLASIPIVSNLFLGMPWNKASNTCNIFYLWQVWKENSKKEVENP